LEFLTAANKLRQILHEEVLVEMVTKDHTVVSVNTELIERDSASEVSVHISWDNHQEDSESGYQNNNMIFLIEKDAG